MVILTTVVTPTYNEANNLLKLIPAIQHWLPNTPILVVDDNSSDGTAEVARTLGAKVVVRTNERGLASAVAEGLKHVRTPTAIVMDADLQHPAEALPSISQALEDHSFVVASRYIPGGGCEKQSFSRRVISRGANLIARPLVPKVHDLMSGFFGLRIAELPPLKSATCKGYKIMLELLTRGSWSSVVEIPYVFQQRTSGESKLSEKQIREYLSVLLSLYHLYLYRYRVLRFMFVGASGTLINLAILGVLTEVLGLYYLVSFAFAFLIAATSNYFLNHWWTFKDKSEESLGYLRFLAITCITLVIDEALLYALTEWLNLWYMLSAVTAIIVTFVTRYTLSKRFIWRK